MRTDNKLCKGCNKCIFSCPTSANYAVLENGENKVNNDSSLCVSCGKCIEICDHNARFMDDDVVSFFDDLQKGKKLSIIVAPSIRNNIENYEKLFGYLKSLGVNFIYDVALGADIATWGYIKVAKDNNLKSIIASPCPVIVEYVENFKPNLIANLVPIYSPAMCVAIYMRKYVGIQDDIAFLSPCYGKSKEIKNDNNSNCIKYNVTFDSLISYMKTNGVDINKYDAKPFDNKDCGMGVAFSRPGGLSENIRYFLGEDTWLYQIEGIDRVKKYLNEYEKRLNDGKPVPFIIDALSCPEGCNLGSGANKVVAVDDLNKNIDTYKKSIKKEQINSLIQEFNKNLEINDFTRKFNDKQSVNTKADKESIEKVFLSLEKFTEEERNINCFSCGLGSCYEFANAVALGKNHIENCFRYAYKKIFEQKESLLEQGKSLIEQKLLLEKKNKELEQAITRTKEVENNLKVEREINDFASQTKYELISLLDVSTKVLSVYKKGQEFESGELSTSCDYDSAAEYVNKTFVHPDDQADFENLYFDSLVTNLNKNGQVVFEHRVKDIHDNCYRWKRLLYRYFKDSNTVIIQLREDIHDDMVIKKELEDNNEKLILHEKCFKALSEHTGKVVFEWHFDTNIITAMSNFKAIFGRDAATINSPEDALSVKAVHPEDRKVFTNVFDAILREEAVDNARFRILDGSGVYHWCSLSGILIKDNQGKPFKAIGILESITEQIKKEESLRNKAERDQLTALYNKTTAENIIVSAINKSDELKNQHALIIIDIDNYKNINDRLGHLFGDIVLTQLAASLKGIFRESDMIGRLGGDEFYVFIENYYNKDLIIKKAEEICKVFRKTYSEGDKHESISASVGIAFYPEHGTNFEELYTNADIALYSVKFGGKNNYKIYNGNEKLNYVYGRTDIDIRDITQKSFSTNRTEYIFKLLYESDDIGININSALQFITELFDFSRGYIFETDSTGKFTDNTFEWCAEGINPEISTLQHVPIELVRTANASFIETGVFITDLKKMSQEERDILERQGIKSMFQFGIMQKGVPIGFIGFDDCITTRFPSSAEIYELKMICNVFATFIAKFRANEYARKNYKAILSVLNNSEGYSYVIEGDTYNVLYENANTVNLMGCSSVGKHCYEVYRNRKTPCEECAINGIKNGVERSTVEIENISFGLFLRASASKIEWLDGNDNYLITSVDITDYKQQKDKLDKDSDKLSFGDQLNDVLVLTHIGTWDWEIKTGKVIYSEAWANILGYTKDELAQTVKTWEKMVLPEDLTYANEQIDRHFRGEKELYEAEFRMTCKDGSIIWAQDKGHVTEVDENGNPIRFVGVLQDVSRIKNAEMLLKENQETLDLAVNVAELGTWDWDIKGNRILYNDEYLEMLGFTQEDMDNSMEEWESTNHPDDLPNTLKALGAYIAGETPKYECEIRMKHKDGHYIWTRDVGRIVARDTEGKPTRIIGGHLNIDKLKRSQEQLHRLAYYDELTGAPTLSKFKIDAQKFADTYNDKKLVLAKFDLQEFRLINQIFGNHVGDQVVINIAKVLKTLTGGLYERFARLHDDEFLVLYTYDELDDIETIKTNFRKQFYTLMGEDFNYNVKIVYGLYYMSVENCFNIPEVIEKANVAHRMAKQQKLETCVYDQEFLNIALKQKKLESKAQKAMDNCEFKVYLQPKYELINQTIVGAEALVRWIDSIGNVIYPNEFIPLFEQNRFIIKLDLYMFEETCKIIKQWIDASISPVPISVNFSRIHQFNETFVHNLAKITDKYNVPHELLQIELTETIVMDTDNHLEEFILALHDNNFKLCIDDFGTGYSSLGLLKNLNVDIIKLDKSFFVDAQANVKAHCVLSNMINLAIDLGIDVVAEGVEQKEHVDLLKKLNCDVIQGYYFSKPITVPHFVEKLKHRSLKNFIRDKNSKSEYFNYHKNNELLSEMVDYMPLAFTLWNKRINVVQCNKEAVNLLKFKDQAELIGKIEQTMPALQSNGCSSIDVLTECLLNAFDNGYVRYDRFLLNDTQGNSIPCELTFVRIVNKGEFMVVCYVRDMSSQLKTKLN